MSNSKFILWWASGGGGNHMMLVKIEGSGYLRIGMWGGKTQANVVVEDFSGFYEYMETDINEEEERAISFGGGNE